MIELAFGTLPEMFLTRVARTPDGEAFRFPSAAAPGGWGRLTWREVEIPVREIACGLGALGLKPEERCAILSSTRLEWILADLGILCAGAASTTIYPSSTAEECAFILTDSEAACVFAEDARQVGKLLAKRGELPGVRQVIVLDGEVPAEASGWALTLAELRDRGRAWDAEHPGRFVETAHKVSPRSLATLIYTSGTTGRPKGVELTHDCWAYTAEAVDSLKIIGPDDVQYLWLPLSHSFGKVLEAVQLRIGFSTAIDGRVDKLVENLATIRPTFVAAVPRIFEKVHNKVLEGASESPTKKRIFDWAFSVGGRVSARRQKGQPIPLFLRLERALADRLVFHKLKARFGGRLRFFVSGAAPLSREVAQFFDSAGIQILEGYGLTETSAASFCNLPYDLRIGTVGPPIPGTEVKIAEDGEILIRSRGVMRGYHHLPEATRETLDADGWLRTGDIGTLDRGYLRITDRKKDLIKTSGGKYVAPQALEIRLKAICPYVSQVLVHGNNRNYVTALITLDEEAIRDWARKHDSLAGLPLPELASRAEVQQLIGRYIDQLNAGLASYETIKKFALLPADFTQESGELTASLKVKRKIVEVHHQSILDLLYSH